MKPNSINITYKGRIHRLNRENTEGKYYQIGFETDRWYIHIYLLEDNRFRIIINKSVKKSAFDYHTQFCYDCYCTLMKSGICLDVVSDPATCKRIINRVKWLVICPMIREIYDQIREELEELHPFDLIHDFRDLERFIYRRMREYGKVEYTINNSLRFGIGENAYTTSEEALQAKEKEPIALLNLFNGHHVVSKDTIVFFLYWLSDRDGKLTIAEGEKTKEIKLKK